MAKLRLLNVGGSTKKIPLGPPYDGMDIEHVLLDIAAGPGVDLIWDARDLDRFNGATYDVVYCSHNLEHFSVKDFPQVLKGFFHVLRPGGIVDIRVPNMLAAIKMTLERNLDLDDTLYVSPGGPISLHDMMYGFGEYVKSGNEFMQHKCGFSPKTLERALTATGFINVRTDGSTLNLVACGVKPQ
jgi:SAM-dependent methyltransferase